MSSQKLSFSGEVLDSKIGLPQAEIKREDNFTEYLVKVYNPDTFKILIHTEGATPTSSNKFFKFFLNANVLKQSSYFSPKEVLEINCTILKSNGKKKTLKSKRILNFSNFKIKIYNNKDQNENEIYTLNFLLFNESIYWATKLVKSTDSPLKMLVGLFNSAISLFSEIKFTISGDIPILSSYCTPNNFSFNISKEFVDLEYSEISNIYLMRNSMVINMKNSISYTFYFEAKNLQLLDHLLNFISFIYGTKIIGLSSCPKLYMDIDLVDSSLFPCQKELCIQQKNYLAYFTSIGKKKEFKIILDLYKIEIPEFEKLVTLKVFINGELFSTHSISTVGRIEIDLSLQRPIHFNSSDEIELKFYKTDKTNIFQDELFFRHKMSLVSQENEFDDKENSPSTKSEDLNLDFPQIPFLEQNSPSRHQNQEDLNLLEFPQIPELKNSEIIHEKSELQSFPEIPEFYEDSNKPSGVSSWSVDRVCQWIRRLGSVYEDKKYDSIFRENQIDGKALLNIEKNDLKEMGIKLMGDRINIMTEINKLK
jgi:hypothetical protein